MVDLAPVVDRLDEALQRINHYRLNKNHQNLLSYPLDADISRPFNNLAYLLIASQVHVITWLPQWLKMFFVTCFQLKFGTIHPCHTAAILSREKQMGILSAHALKE